MKTADLERFKEQIEEAIVIGRSLSVGREIEIILSSDNEEIGDIRLSSLRISNLEIRF